MNSHKIERGTVRASDGLVFDGMGKCRKGNLYEVWRHPSYWDKMKERRIRRKELKRAYDMEFRSRNKEAIKQSKKEYNERTYIQRRDKIMQSALRWRKNNPHVATAILANRRAKLKNAICKDSKKKWILEVYSMARRITQCTGIPFHVDHIHPISRGGKHHQSNLQVLPAVINFRKNAKLDYKIPFL